MGRLLASLFTVALVSPGFGSVASQDRADLAGKIDTWYKVVQGNRTAGYVHETLNRVSAPWRYEYALEGEFELTIRGRSHTEDQTVAAFLDDTLSPTEISLESHANEAESGLAAYSSGDDRRVEIRPASSEDPVAWVLPAREEFHVLPAITLYALRQNETLGKAGRVTLRVADRSGREKSGVEVVLEVRDSVRREYRGKEVTAVPVTFLKPFPAALRETELREAYVDRYGRLLEATMVGGARIVMAEGKAEALAGLAAVRRHGRRDPFDRLAALKYAALERARALRGETLPPPPVVTLDSLDSDLAAAAKLLEEVRSQKAAGGFDEARQSYLKALVHLKAIRDLASRRRANLLPAVDRLRDDAELAWDGAAQLKSEAGRAFVEVERQVERLDIGALEKTHKDLQAFRDRIEVEGRPERDSIARWAVETGTLVVKCRTRLELAQARLEVSGITVGEKETKEWVDSRYVIFGQEGGALQEVTFVRPFEMAQINGKPYRKGDVIEFTQIRVDRITRLSVQFSLRDEVREVGLHR
jgi:hypothetical protein